MISCRNWKTPLLSWVTLMQDIPIGEMDLRMQRADYWTMWYHRLIWTSLMMVAPHIIICWLAHLQFFMHWSLFAVRLHSAIFPVECAGWPLQQQPLHNNFDFGRTNILLITSEIHIRKGKLGKVSTPGSCDWSCGWFLDCRWCSWCSEPYNTFSSWLFYLKD